MPADTLRRAVRDGPRAFPVGEYGTLAWFVGAVLWWRLWAIALVAVVAVELAYRSMAAFGDGFGVVAVLLIGFATSEVGDWISLDDEEVAET